ncbi:MAG: DUF2127 domain-containing protein [Verrucomicrobiota bacterium]|jgi:uncharacterized membrane protein (DUF2068 family)
MPSEQKELGEGSAVGQAEPPLKKHAVTLYAIIYFKLAKGIGFLLLALFLYKQANNNSSSAFSENEIKDLPMLVTKLRRQFDPVSAFLWLRLSAQEQAMLKSYRSSAPGSNQTQEVVVKALNDVLLEPSIYDPERFNGLTLRPETIKLIKESPGGSRSRLNRLLLEDAYPVELSRNHSTLPQEYESIMHAPATIWVLDHLKIHPESQFFINLAEQIGDLTENKVHRLALGMVLFSLFPLVEGIGMLFRVSWACWLAIGESAFFIPIEFHALLNPVARFRLSILVATIINIIFVWYLYVNRDVLFHHHHSHRHSAPGT